MRTGAGRLAAWLRAAILAAVVGGAVTAAAEAAPRASSPAAVSGAAREAPAETLAVLVPSAGWPAPLALRAWPDSVRFGDAVGVAADFAAGAAVGGAGAVQAGPDWLALAPAARKSTPAGVPPAGGGPRLVWVARVYREGPVRFAWGGKEGIATGAVRVASRVGPGAAPSPVADPRGLGWRGWRLAGLAAGLLAIALLVDRLWRRPRARGPVPAPLLPPAYLAAAVALRGLHREGLPALGKGRRFLDRLSGCARAYLAEQYRIPAGELTPEEISARLLELRHETRIATAWAELLAGCDHRRYAPTAVAAAACDAALRRAVDLIGRARIPARYTPVPPQLAVEGEAAWSALLSLAGPPAPAAADAVGAEKSHA